MDSRNLHFYRTGARQVKAIEEPIAVPGAGEVLVKIAFTALSPGSNLTGYREELPNSQPQELLYMGCGTVANIGPGVTQWAPGDRVVLSTGHQAFTVVPQGSLHRVPPGVSLRTASLSYLSSWSISPLHLAQYMAAENVVVIGQGLVGASAAMVAELMGARVVALDTDARRVAFASKLGIGTVVQPGAPGAADAISDFLGERGADLIIETSGHWAGFKQAVQLARDYTRLAIMGIYRQPPPTDLGNEIFQLMYASPSAFHYKRLQIIGCGSDPDAVQSPNPRMWTRRSNFAYILEQTARGRYNLDGLITHCFHPDQIAEAMDRMLSGDTEMVGVIFDWTAT